MLLKRLLVVSLTLVIYNGFSQSYTENREKFVKEFEKSLSEYGGGDYHDFAKKELPVMLLETNEFPEEYFRKMVATCNLMEQKKLKAYPEIYNYVFSVASFIKNKQSAASYTAWHSSVDKMLQSRYVNKFEDFIEMSANFFSQQIISVSANFIWYYEGGKYEFEYTDKAFINFSGGNLICRVKSSSGERKEKNIDSLNLYGTTGTYDPLLKKWEGRGGTITWEKVGLERDKTHGEVYGYGISMKSSNLNVDTVSLTTPYFSKPILGRLNDRAFKINREEDKIFPQFLSFEKKLIIENIIENVDYIGGFSLQGNTFYGAGTNQEPARISYKKNNKPFVTATATQVFLSPKKVYIPNARCNLYLNTGDSIYHPGLEFTYDLEKKNIQLLRTSSGVGLSPFQNSYHQLYIYVPKISWDEGTDNLSFTFDFGTSREQRLATFESMNYFNERQYDNLQGMSSMHPLVALYDYSYKYDEKTFTEGKAASSLKLTIDQAKPILLELANLGFLTFDTEAKTVTLTDKTENFVRAKAGSRDYDNIVFVADLREKELKGFSDEEIKKDAYLKSVKELYDKQNEERRLIREFGMMDLTTLDLDLEVVDKVVISEITNTVVFPENSAVKIKKNRNFNFQGWINSGKMEMHASGVNFLYDEFKFKLLQTEKSLFRVHPLQKEDGNNSIAMISSISGITGELFINDPTNRSGMKKGFEKYPLLKSERPSHIYYNSKEVFRGSYDSSRFYYTLEPFVMDSLNGFSERALRFKGELVSAGIFPVIKEDIRIMPDYSFGFATKAPEGGYKFYGTEAKYENKIVLSHNGLQGSGTINYIHAHAVSKALNFLPDSTIGYAEFVNDPIETGVEFPDVKCSEAFIVYVPKGNVLKAQSTPKKELEFLNGEVKLRGTAFVKPDGMTGRGIMNFATATLTSDNFNYTRWDINADTSEFNLKNNDEDLTEDPLAFKTDNVKSHVSFKDRIGEFHSNDGESTVEFPVNQYICKMDFFKWFMDDSNIEMSKAQDKDMDLSAGVDLLGPNFYSTHPKQDSLQFRAPKAKFDLKAKSIYCDEVEYMDIADARIYPDSMKVNIRKKAKLDDFHNAKIIANYITKYHTFVNCDVQVTARMSYSGKGIYPYYDIDSNLTNFVMDKIYVDSTLQTDAYGKIPEEMGFQLSEQFDFIGNVTVQAELPTIIFKGATRIVHDCKKFDRSWIAFSADIDPANIQIPIEPNMKNMDGISLFSGMAWRNSAITDSLDIYPVFMSPLVKSDDPLMMSVSGLLQYDETAKEFQLASKDKLLNMAEKGNYISLNTESCSLHGLGKINLGLDLGDMKADAVGSIDYNNASGQTSMNLTMRFDMPIDKGAMEGVANRMNAVEGLEPMNMAPTTLKEALVEWSDLEKASKIESDYTIKGELKKLPEEMEKTILITGLKISSFDKVSFQEKGMISTEEFAYIVNIYDKPIAKKIPVKVFFQQIYSESSADKFGLQVNVPGGGSYYFDYTMVKKDGEMKIITTDEEFSATVSAIKEDKRKIKNFKYEISTQSIYLSKFLRLFGQ